MSRKRALGLCVSLEVPEVEGHPNRLAFEGVLTLVDVPSDAAPSGARGHRVVLTRLAAEAALPGLMGMGVGYKTGWDGHDARQKMGIVTGARIERRELQVSGFVFGKDFPEVRDVDAGGLGMSYEIADARVADMRAKTWVLTRVTFTGAAVILREKCAYRATSFKVSGAQDGPAE